MNYKFKKSYLCTTICFNRKNKTTHYILLQHNEAKNKAVA